LVLTYKVRTDLTASEARAIFQDALERELVRAIEPYLDLGAERERLLEASMFWFRPLPSGSAASRRAAAAAAR
jgi:hypothetical protein